MNKKNMEYLKYQKHIENLVIHLCNKQQQQQPFEINNAKHYILVVTLSINDYINFLEI